MFSEVHKLLATKIIRIDFYLTGQIENSSLSNQELQKVEVNQI